MLSRMSTFTNLPMPLRVGVILVSGGGILAVTRYFLPPNLRWIILGGLAVVALLIVLYWRLLKWLKKRKATPMERGVLQSSGATPQGVSEPERMARIDDLRKKFEDGIAKFRAAGKSLYSLPWYMVVGEPGSGKTEAVRHCNIGFPPGLHDQFQGVGGTINMNWWFTDHAVIVDTAGRLMFEEVEAGGSNEWKEFLNLLKKSRVNCPINGVFLVIPADSLIKDSADEIEKKASKIAQQFDVIQRTLDVRFPVFVVVTKSDLINGFREFFDSLDDPQLQHQILGWSNPAPLDESYNPKFVDQHLEAIRKRLFRRRLLLMQELISDRAEDQEKPPVEALYAFPQSLAQLAPRMKRYLELIFSVGSQWSCRPLFFRGIYFTSSMQEGVALDEDLAQSLGVTVDSLPDGPVWKRDRAYFLRDLFMKKVFCEQGLVTRATNTKKQHTRRKATVLLSAVASVVLLLFFTVYAAVGFSRSIGKLKDYLVAAIDEPEFNNVRIIECKSGNNYRYYGNAGVRIKNQGETVDLGVKRYEYYSQLINTARRWETKGVPWVFAPAAKVAKNIKPERLHKALATIYELGVLQPFYTAASNIMKNQEDGEWAKESIETAALCQLISIKADRSLRQEGQYTSQALLDPFFQYILRNDENLEELKKWYNDQRGLLHYPLDVIYNKSDNRNDAWANWPPQCLQTDVNQPDSAIANGVFLFNRYWNDQSLTGDDNLKIKTIEDISKAMEEFIAAEKTILVLYENQATKSDERVTCDWFDSEKWSENFERLQKAKKNIDNYKKDIEKGQSLESSWGIATANVLRNVKTSYEDLLCEFQDVESTVWLAEIRNKLKEELEKRENELRDSEFEEKLKEFDKQCWTRLGNSHLYEIRFEIYTQANEQLKAEPYLSDFIEVPVAIEKITAATTNAEDNINRLLNLDREASHLQNAADISLVGLCHAKQRSFNAILQKGLKLAPNDIIALENRVSEIAKKVLNTNIPRKLEYTPQAAKVLFDAWGMLGRTLEKCTIQDIENSYKKITNEVYVEYTKQYMNYWLYDIPKDIVTEKVKRDIINFDKLMVRKVLNELDEEVGQPIEDALDEFNEYISDDNKEVKKFRSNLEKIRNEGGYRKTYEECRRILSQWRGLPEDKFEKREKLLYLLPVDFRQDYTPFDYELPAEFVDMYWYKLSRESLQLLSDQIQTEGKKALKELQKYAGKFPLNKNGTEELEPDAINEVRLLLDQILISGGKYASKTIGQGANTGIVDIDEQLERLRNMDLKLSKTEKNRLESVKQIVLGLPPSGEQYYCQVKLLTEEELHKKGIRDFQNSDLRKCSVAQGNYKPLPFKTDHNGETVCEFKYPNEQIRFDFYRFPDSHEIVISKVLLGRWACLRMLQVCAVPDVGKGCIRLTANKVVDKQELKAVLYLRLSFFRDADCRDPVIFPEFNMWP